MLSIKQNGAYANADIPLGITILTSEPIMHVLFPSFYSTHCEYCLDDFDKLYRCAGCKLVHYCSKEHQKLAWKKYHSQECKLLFKVNSVDLLLLMRVVNSDINLDDLYKPIVSKNFDQNLEIAQYAINNKLIISKDIRILTNILSVFESNNFVITDKMLDNIAVGIYPTAAKLNHSCQPNCIKIYNQGVQYIRSIKTIKYGEELYHSYIDNGLPKKLRIYNLCKVHDFICKCKKCELEILDLYLDNVSQKLISYQQLFNGYMLKDDYKNAILICRKICTIYSHIYSDLDSHSNYNDLVENTYHPLYGLQLYILASLSHKIKYSLLSLNVLKITHGPLHPLYIEAHNFWLSLGDNSK